MEASSKSSCFAEVVATPARLDSGGEDELMLCFTESGCVLRESASFNDEVRSPFMPPAQVGPVLCRKVFASYRVSSRVGILLAASPGWTNCEKTSWRRAVIEEGPAVLHSASPPSLARCTAS